MEGTRPIWYFGPEDHQVTEGGMKPGWYFEDESEGLNGPYDTKEIASFEFAAYCEHYL